LTSLSLYRYCLRRHGTLLLKIGRNILCSASVLIFNFQGINGKRHSKIHVQKGFTSGRSSVIRRSVCFQLKSQIDFLEVLLLWSLPWLQIFSLPLCFSPAEEIQLFRDVVFKNRNMHFALFLFLCLIQFNSIQFFIIYVPSQQLQGQLQTQHGAGTRIIMQ
jgi:hypothetical protein